MRFVNGHNARLPRSAEHAANVAAALRGQERPWTRGANAPTWRGDDAGYDAMHRWLNQWHPKSGICENCGITGRRTHYAFLHHPERHTRNREDYRELCTSCHKRFDGHTSEQGFRNGGWEKRRAKGRLS